MTSVFVDTWAWYALVDTNDDDHALAQLANEELLAKGHTFVTTNFVLDETLTLIRYNVHHAAVVGFRRMMQRLIDAGLVELVHIDERYEELAWQIFERYSDQKFSFTDCTSFAVMHDLELAQVFTADHHFAVMGYILTP